MSLSLSSSLGGASKAADEPDLWKPGDVLFGKIEILDVVGKGGGHGLGVPRAALGMGSELAVKVPHPRLTQDDEARERGLWKPRRGSEVGVHPNIVQCLVRPRVEQHPAAVSQLSGGRQPRGLVKANSERELETILDYAVQACDGLIYAHARD